MTINKLEGIKPFNDLMLKSCYYNQLAAGYSAFGIDPKIIACNYLQLYEFDEKTKKLVIKHIELLDESDLFDLTGIKRTFVEFAENLKNFVITQIDNQCPVIIPVDGFSLTYRKDIYKKIHSGHFILIYGYDKHRNKFYINEHAFLNSLDYREKFESIQTISRAYKQFFSELAKENKKLTIVLSRQKQPHGSFPVYYNKAIRKMDSQIIQSEKYLIQGIRFIKDCMSDDVEREKYQDQIINFLGNIKWYKNLQNNIFHSILNHIELQKVTEQIYENFIFIYGMIVKQKITGNINKTKLSDGLDRLECHEREFHRYLREVTII